MVRNMTDFCESFVYENDSATVSDLAELYNIGQKRSTAVALISRSCAFRSSRKSGSITL